MSTNVQRRSGFSMIELVFVIVILGVLAAVAVPRFVATRTDAQVATARSDMAAAQKVIVAKVFADNIDTTIGRAPDPNIPVRNQSLTDTTGGMSWAEWIVEISGLDGSRWKTGGNGVGVMQTMRGTVGNNWDLSTSAVEPVGNVKEAGGAAARKAGCGAMLGVFGGYMIFAPNNLGQSQTGATTQSRGDFCDLLKTSYQSSGGWGNRIVPLASSGTVEF